MLCVGGSQVQDRPRTSSCSPCMEVPWFHPFSAHEAKGLSGDSALSLSQTAADVSLALARCQPPWPVK